LFLRACDWLDNRIKRQAIRIIVATAVSACAVNPIQAIEASNVLVLYNDSSPEGIEIANYYAQVYPKVRLLGLSGVSTSEEINQNQYLDVIRPQVLAGLNDSTEVIVTTKGLPLRIKNTLPNPGTYDGWRGDVFGVPINDGWWESYSSLESELTRIDLIDSAEMMGDQAEFMSPPNFPFSTVHQAANPYYKNQGTFDRNDPGNEGIRLTSRLDGFSVGDVKDIIDRAQAAFKVPSQQLVIVDDDPNALAGPVDLMPQLVQDVLIPLGQPVIFDNTVANIVEATMPVIGYVSHGSHATGVGPGYTEDLDFELANGAVFQTWESFNAYSFVEGNNLYGQGLVGEWFKDGGTAALGHVQEPGASPANVTNEDLLWDMLLRGYTFAEAAWSATPQLSFVNTVIGDPLMTFRDWVTADADLDGVVGSSDLSIVLNNWGKNTTLGLEDGDITFDGRVGMDDLNLLLNNWNMVSMPAQVIVPEPVSAVWLLVGASSLALRRHRESS
jgi:uncharacterized protein (TIGR03790 family)